MVNEKLKDKVIVEELGNENILIVNDGNNFKSKLFSLGFEKVGRYYSISIPVKDVEKCVDLIRKLMEIGALFSYGKDWSPSEIVRYYRDEGLIDGHYMMISWRNQQEFNITIE